MHKGGTELGMVERNQKNFPKMSWKLSVIFYKQVQESREVQKQISACTKTCRINNVVIWTKSFNRLEQTARLDRKINKGKVMVGGERRWKAMLRSSDFTPQARDSHGEFKQGKTMSTLHGGIYQGSSGGDRIDCARGKTGRPFQTLLTQEQELSQEQLEMERNRQEEGLGRRGPFRMTPLLDGE